MSMEFGGYSETKKMQPLKEFAKKLHPEIFDEESGIKKAEGKRAHEQEGKIRFAGVGASAKPDPQKPGARYAKRLKSYLQQEHDEMPGQDENEDEDEENKEEEEKEEEKHDEADHLDTRNRAELLSKRRSFRIAELARTDDSESRTLRSEGSRRNVPYTGGQPSTQGTSVRPGKLSAGESDPQTGSSRDANKILSTGFTPINKDTPQRALGSSGQKR